MPSRRVNPKLLYTGLGICLFITGWQILALLFSDLIISSPLETLASLWQMARTASFWQSIALTMGRFGLGFFFGAVLGFGLGVAAGLNDKIKWLLEPFRWIIMTIPPVVLVLFCMIWFGMGSTQTIVVTAVLIFPFVYINTVEGMETVSPELLQMAKAYKSGLALRLQDIYIPSATGHIMTGLSMGTGMGIRIIILAEILGSNSGIGYEFTMARVNVETPVLFAWVLVCLLLVSFLELVLLNPVKKYLMRWKEAVK